MGWTKGELLNAAFGEIGLADYVFDLSPEQLIRALKSLDAMMAAWTARGIRQGYATPVTSGSSTLADDSLLPDWAVEAVYQNLALRLAPSVGRPVSMELNKNAKLGYDALLSEASHPPEMRAPPTLPSGAGVKPWRGPQRPFIDDPDDTIEIGTDSELNIERGDG